MTENPFQSPQFPGGTANADTDLRKRAQRSFHALTLVLLVPAVYNFWELHARVAGPGPVPSHAGGLDVMINGLGLALCFGLIWFLGLPGLEAVARLLRNLFASGTDPAAWQETLHRSLPRAAYLAVPGAVLWMVWVFGFYRLHVNFYAISWAIGVPAHLLGACWYAPLIYRWYQLAASRPPIGILQK